MDSISEADLHPDLMQVSAYDYDLPEGLIARYPLEERDASRLLVLPRGSNDAKASRPGEPEHLRFSDLPGLLREGDLLVLNDSRVLPARLLGRKPTGAAGEVLLIRPHAHGERCWEALVRPGSKLKPGTALVVSPELTVRILDGLPGGSRVVRLDCEGDMVEALERFGHVPLPPYLEREDEALDRERYQTVYASAPGSSAAPTAGLHFTDDLLAEIRGRGVEVAKVTLHVGPGTFRPVDVEDLREHELHSEIWQLPSETAEAVNRTRTRGGRIWAVGTTVVRTLESAALAAGKGVSLQAGSGETSLFIHPGFSFRVVDGMITNFHLPRSTLLMLVAAFAGYKPTMLAYGEAVSEGYRFYSYGDAMVIPPRDEGGAE